MKPPEIYPIKSPIIYLTQDMVVLSKNEYEDLIEEMIGKRANDNFSAKGGK